VGEFLGPFKPGVKPIHWACFSPRVQAHGQCRYCGDPARYMRHGGLKGEWIALCEWHARERPPRGAASRGSNGS
jgi:hypothetical protein